MSKHLHIINGDIVGSKLKQSKLDGEFLAWKDMLFAGPLNVCPYPELLNSRALYFEKTLGIPYELFRSICLEQEQELQQLSEYQEVTLWFEHDLFDQTIFLYLLYRLNQLVQREKAELKSNGMPRLTYIVIDSFPGYSPFHGMGQLEPAELAALWPQRCVLDESLLAEGADLWKAYTDTNPVKLVELLGGEQGNLPISRKALSFHLERYPRLEDGLSSLERSILEAINEGVRNPNQLFNHLFAEDTRYGLGDLSFWAYLNSMREEEHPLIAWDQRLHLPKYDGPKIPEDLEIELTDWGKRILEGRADRIELNGIDRWLGGTHIRDPQTLWRWSTEEASLIQISGNSSY